MTTVTVTATGGGSFTIPAGVFYIEVELWASGSPGDNISNQGSGGHGGGYTKVAYNVVPGDVIYWNVAPGPASGGGITSTWINLNNNSPTGGTRFRSVTGRESFNGGTEDSIYSVLASYAGGAGAPAQGGGGTRAGSGGGGAAGPLGVGLDGFTGNAATRGAGGAGNNGSGGAGGTTGAGTANADGGGGGAGGLNGGAGNAGGAPGGGGGGSGRSNTVGGAGARGQIRYTYTVATLNTLTGSFTVPNLPANGTVVGTPTGYTTGSTKSLSDNAGGRFTINSSTGEITVANGSLINHASNTSHNITVVETLSGATGSPKSTVLTINVNPPSSPWGYAQIVG